MTIPTKIRNARKRLGITQATLAECLGVPPNQVTQWESDAYHERHEMRLSTLRRLSGALGLEWSDLVEDFANGNKEGA